MNRFLKGILGYCQADDCSNKSACKVIMRMELKSGKTIKKKTKLCENHIMQLITGGTTVEGDRP
jgi:hypothetical protein